jgi:hypothetical protein
MSTETVSNEEKGSGVLADVMRGVTMKQMCEHIVKADLLERPDGTKPTAKEIFNYSSTGELYMVFEWYKMACEVLKHHA